MIQRGGDPRESCRFGVVATRLVFVVGCSHCCRRGFSFCSVAAMASVASSSVSVALSLVSTLMPHSERNAIAP